jgi:hypothetical protein
MKPPGIHNFVFIAYRNIKVNKIDFFEDAWGINNEFCDVFELLSRVKAVPGKRLTKRLIERIRSKK